MRHITIKERYSQPSAREILRCMQVKVKITWYLRKKSQRDALNDINFAKYQEEKYLECHA